jgi:ribosomal-protein-serine acetyltransferase
MGGFPEGWAPGENYPKVWARRFARLRRWRSEGRCAESEPVITLSSGEAKQVEILYVEPFDGYRILFDWYPTSDSTEPVDMRVPALPGDAISETWLYQSSRPRRINVTTLTTGLCVSRWNCAGWRPACQDAFEAGVSVGTTRQWRHHSQRMSVNQAIELRAVEALPAICIARYQKQNLAAKPPLTGRSTLAAKDTRRNVQSNQMLHQRGYAKMFLIFMNDELVACCRSTRSTANKTGYIGYWLDEAHQGQGILSQALQAFMRYYVERGEIRRFVIKCRVDNQHSNRWRSKRFYAGRLSARKRNT